MGISKLIAVELCRYEGLVLSVCGDGKAYSLILEACSMDDPSHKIVYFARFATRLGYSRVCDSSLLV